MINFLNQKINQGILTNTVTLTNAQIKAMRATPVTLVPAPTNGRLEFLGATLRLNGATNALTETADNMAIRFTDGSGAIVSQTIEATGFIDQTAATETSALPKIDAIVASSASLKKPLVLHNTGDGEYGGNAANDATLTAIVSYRIIAF